MGIQPTSNLGSHRYCCSGDMVVYLVVEGQDSTYPRFIPPLPFTSKAHDIPNSHIQNVRI